MAKTKRGATLKSDSSVTSVMAAIRSRFGPHAVHFASQAEFIKVKRQPTGCVSLDFALGGGYPYGRYVHIYGPEGVAKTFLAMLAAATVHYQDPEALVVWVDLERVFDEHRARQVGVDLSRLILVQDPSIEGSISIAEQFIHNRSVRLFVFDSVAAVATLAELEGDMDDQQMGSAARVLNKFLRRWTAKNAPTANKPPSSFVILLNQVREKIGGFSGKIPPKPKPTGGRGLMFFASMNIEVARGEQVKSTVSDDDNDETILGHEVKALVVKNNTFPPYRVAKFLLVTRSYDMDGYQLHANSIDNPRDLVRYARNNGVFAESGKWLKFEDNKWNGKMAAQKALAADPELARSVYDQIMQSINQKLGRLPEASEEESQARKKIVRRVARKVRTGKR